MRFVVVVCLALLQALSLPALHSMQFLQDGGVGGLREPRSREMAMESRLASSPVQSAVSRRTDAGVRHSRAGTAPNESAYSFEASVRIAAEISRDIALRYSAMSHAGAALGAVLPYFATAPPGAVTAIAHATQPDVD